MTLLCKYCGKTYANKYSLKKHQSVNAACLRERNKKVIKEKCDYCGKVYIHLVVHLKTCKIKEFSISHDTEIEKLREKLNKKNIKNKELSSEIRTLTKENAKLLDKNKKLEVDLLEQQGVVKGDADCPR